MDIAQVAPDVDMDGRSFYRDLLSNQRVGTNGEIVPLLVEYQGGSIATDAVGKLLQEDSALASNTA